MTTENNEQGDGFTLDVGHGNRVEVYVDDSLALPERAVMVVVTAMSGERGWCLLTPGQAREVAVALNAAAEESRGTALVQIDDRGVARLFTQVRRGWSADELRDAVLAEIAARIEVTIGVDSKPLSEWLQPETDR